MAPRLPTPPVLIGCIPGDRPHLFLVAVWEKPENVKDWKVPRGEVTQIVRRHLPPLFDAFAFPGRPPGWGTEAGGLGQRAREPARG